MEVPPPPQEAIPATPPHEQDRDSCAEPPPRDSLHQLQSIAPPSALQRPNLGPVQCTGAGEHPCPPRHCFPVPPRRPPPCLAPDVLTGAGTQAARRRCAARTDDGRD